MAKRPKSGKYLQVVHVGVMADVVMEAGALVWEAVVGRRGGALLGLGHGDHVIGSAPEEEGHDDRAPHVGEQVEERVRPVAQHGDGRGEARGQPRREPGGEPDGVQRAAQLVDQREGAEEGEERAEDRVEEGLPAEAVGHRAVQHGEADRAGQVDPRLEERDGLGRGARGGHNEHILGVAQDGVVEEDAEEPASAE